MEILKMNNEYQDNELRIFKWKKIHNKIKTILVQRKVRLI